MKRASRKFPNLKLLAHGCLVFLSVSVGQAMYATDTQFSGDVEFQGEGYFEPLQMVKSASLGGTLRAVAIRPQRYFLGESSIKAFYRTAAIIDDRVRRGLPVRQDFAIVIDLTLPADGVRMWTLKLREDERFKYADVMQFHVAHGGGQNYLQDISVWTSAVSSESGSGRTSHGAYLTAQPFTGGRVGPSFWLDGLEPAQALGFGLPGNSRARRRQIVLHSDNIIEHPTIHGRPFLSPTMGCFGISPMATGAIYSELESQPANPTLLYAYWDQESLATNQRARGVL